VHNTYGHIHPDVHCHIKEAKDGRVALKALLELHEVARSGIWPMNVDNLNILSRGFPVGDRDACRLLKRLMKLNGGASPLIAPR